MLDSDDAQAKKRRAVKLVNSSITVSSVIMRSWRLIADGQDLDCYEPQFFDWLEENEACHD